MEIGPPRRVIEIEPVTEPVPSGLPDLEPAEPDPRTEPAHEPAPAEREPVSSVRGR